MWPVLVLGVLGNMRSALEERRLNDDAVESSRRVVGHEAADLLQAALENAPAELAAKLRKFAFSIQHESKVVDDVMHGIQAKVTGEGFIKRLEKTAEVAFEKSQPKELRVAPSSFAQISENPDDGFAKVEAKLKALQDKIKADTAKFEAEAKAAPSSFAQVSENPDDGFAKVEAKLKALQEKIKADSAKFEEQAKSVPSSLVQLTQSPDDGFAGVEAKLKALQDKIKADTAKFEAEAKAAPSSFAQVSENPDDGFEKVEAKLAALKEKIKADTAKFEHDKASSFAQVSENPDDGFSKVEAKLKALKDKIKADTAKFEAEAKAAPSSFAQVSENPMADQSFANVEAKLKALKEKIKADSAKFDADVDDDKSKAAPSSFIQTVSADATISQLEQEAAENEKKDAAIRAQLDAIQPYAPKLEKKYNFALLEKKLDSYGDELGEVGRNLDNFKGVLDTPDVLPVVPDGATSFAQISENPDDGFAKVEAKLKALQEKIKADTAKFEAEAKAAPSSLLQRFDDSKGIKHQFDKIDGALKGFEDGLQTDIKDVEDNDIAQANADVAHDEDLYAPDHDPAAALKEEEKEAKRAKKAKKAKKSAK